MTVPVLTEAAPGSAGPSRAGLRWLRQLRPWLAVLGGCVAVGELLAPAGQYARQYVFAESLQFLVFAVVAPALLTVGAPWHRLRLAPGWGRTGGAAVRRTDLAGAAARFGASRATAVVARTAARLGVGRPGVARPAMVLVVFLAVCVAWRLPAAMTALARYPGLAVAELASLLVAGTALWLELVPSAPFRPRVSRLLRAVMAAVAMWALWILGYILGFTPGSWSAGYLPATGHGLSTAADQQIAAGLLWVVPAICFLPVIFSCALSWIAGAEDLDEELRRMSTASAPAPATGRAGRLRPPRGWR